MQEQPFSGREMKNPAVVVKQTAQAGKKRAAGGKKGGAGKSSKGGVGRSAGTVAVSNLTGSGQHRLSETAEEYVLSPLVESDDRTLHLVLNTQYISYIQLFDGLIWVYIDGDMIYYQADGDEEYHRSCCLFEPSEVGQYRRIVQALQGAGVTYPPSPHEEAAPGQKKPITMQEVS